MIRESQGDLKKRVSKIITILKKHYPNATTALHHRNPLELLVATILSAQCTDERVNAVTKELFKKYKSAEDYAKADLKQFEQEIRTTGFYHNKAKNVIAAAKQIVERFGGKVPDNMDDLLSLPGVARKTANVVLGNAFGKNEGIVVDTHVRRVAYRLGLTEQKDAGKIEADLMKLVPQNQWTFFGNALILHGRAYCNARKPNCDECPLEKLCPRVGVDR